MINKTIGIQKHKHKWLYLILTKLSTLCPTIDGPGGDYYIIHQVLLSLNKVYTYIMHGVGVVGILPHVSHALSLTLK